MDKKKALKYFKLASEQGDVDAQFHSGLMYIKGDGVEQDVGEALKIWELAAAPVRKKTGFSGFRVDHALRLLAFLFEKTIGDF